MNSLALSPRAVARALGGEARGNRVMAPGPGHSRRDRSLSIHVDPAYPDGFWITPFAGDDPLACKDHVRDRLGLQRPASGLRRPVAPVRGGCCPEPPEADDAARTARALAIWAEGRPPAGTPVDIYLSRRGLTLPDGAEAAIRYHAFCPFAGKGTPAMVALVRDIHTDAPKAIHRTALTLDGHKVKVADKDRLALGPLAGGAVKLTPDAEVTLCLGIGEGLESTLSLRELPEFGRSPVWSLLSAGGVAAFPVLGGVEALWIAVDRDPAGERAAHACADRWRAAAREVFFVAPKAERADLNDLNTIRRRCHDAR